MIFRDRKLKWSYISFMHGSLCISCKILACCIESKAISQKQRKKLLRGLGDGEAVFLLVFLPCLLLRIHERSSKTLHSYIAKKRKEKLAFRFIAYHITQAHSTYKERNSTVSLYIASKRLLLQCQRHQRALLESSKLVFTKAEFESANQFRK